MKQWFAVHTQPRGETLARLNLLRQGFDAYLPQYLKRRRHARRTDWAAKPLFPRYLFVHMDLGVARWRAIQSTFGVSHLVCNGEAPACVPDGIVEDIMARHDDRGLVVMTAEPPPFEKGQAVRVTAGALAEQVGWFEGISDDERVILLLQLLGREIRVRVPVEAVAAFA